MNWWQFLLFLVLFFFGEFFFARFVSNEREDSSATDLSAAEESSVSETSKDAKKNEEKVELKIVESPPVQYDLIEVDNLIRLDDNICYINSRLYEINNTYGRYGKIIRVFDDYLVLKDMTAKKKYYILTEKKYLTEREREKDKNIENMNLEGGE